jgi:DNA-binding NarL/FixJ family response regulator
VGEASDRGKLRVVVVDDSEVVRAKLRSLLATDDGFELVGEAENGAGGLAVAKEQQPDLVVMDLRMPGMSGIEAIWQLGTISPASRVLVLTVSAEQEDVTDAIIAGANGYVVKGAKDDEITSALRGVAAGKRVISHQVASKLVDRVGGERRSNTRATTPSPSAPAAPRVPTPPARPAAQTSKAPPPAPAPRRPTSETVALVIAIAVVTGLVLTAISQGQQIIDGTTTSDTWIKAGLNFVVALAAVGLAVLVGRFGD